VRYVPKLAQLTREMTPQERAEVEAFRPLSLSGGINSSPNFSLTNLIQELTELVATSGSF